MKQNVIMWAFGPKMEVGRGPGAGGRGGVFAPNLVPILEQRIDEKDPKHLNSVFRVSVKTTLFAVLSEKLPFSAALLMLSTLNNECFFFLHYHLKN